MNVRVITVIAGIFSGAGGLIVGALIRQPEINKLQKQVKKLQGNMEQLESVVTEQNEEIAKLIIEYKSLQIYQISQRRELRDTIQDDLICQYAAIDYLTLIINCVDTGRKMNKEEVHFYHTYSKMLKDNIIDDSELEVLRPIILLKHSKEIKRLEECNSNELFDRIREYEKRRKVKI